MKTLYLAWQDRESRRWFPVGRLVCDDDVRGEFGFVYIQGALEAKKSAGFVEIPGFPDLNTEYRSKELFPAFRNRTMHLSRPDRAEYLGHLGLDEARWNAIAELSVSGGVSQADNLEVFPAIVPDQEGKIHTRFVLHGIRHLNQHSIERAASLEAGETLRLAFELNNPAVAHAVLVMSDDYYTLGWLPRYLVDSMHGGNGWLVSDVAAIVARVNSNAPLSNRVLVDFTGRLQSGFSPMEEVEQFSPIAVGAGDAEVETVGGGTAIDGLV